MTTPDPRLQRLLGGPLLAAVRQRLRRHFERGGTAEGVLQLGQLQAAEREALALLSGRTAKPARSLRLDLAELQDRLQSAGVAASLRAALEQLDGPITDRFAERAAAQATWLAVLSRPGRHPCLHAWLQASTAAGFLKRISRQDARVADNFLSQAARVLERLPAPGLPRSQLAAQILGDAHALDPGRPVAALVLAAWRHSEAARDVSEADPGDEPPDSAREELPGLVADERTRDIWARAGVLVNELARPVLVLNLPAPIGLNTVPWLPGEPGYLSLRWLLRAAPQWAVASRTVFVCENPNLLAIAADQLGTCCAPLVCTDGMPAAAQRTLLQQLAQSGARLRYHGDFDWAGLRIANYLLRHAGAAPWRMSTADYESAARSATPVRHDLAASETEADWDVHLARTMRQYGLAIAEEAVADSLFDDLSLS
jgi:uncharacterized protein (TIGR02679 family)